MSVSTAHAVVATAFNAATESDPVFAPTTILALVLFSMLTLCLCGAPLFLAIRNQNCRSGVPNAQDVECRPDKNAYTYFEAVDAGIKGGSASQPSWFTSWFSGSSTREPQPEPELAWPVYTIVPHLRPEVPLHVRVLKALTFWNRGEVKREAFTMVDLQKAMEDCEAKARFAAAPGPDQELKHTRRWWTAFFASGGSTVPEIVIHPCDGSPAFPYADEFAPPPLPRRKTPATVARHALASPSIVNAAPDFSPASPTASEPDSPMPATPVPETEILPVILPAVTPLDLLEVPMPSSTAPTQEVGKDDAVNLSSFSGNVFVLDAPPHSKKFASSAAGARVSRVVVPIAPNVGLGLDVDEPQPVFVIQCALSPSNSSSTSLYSVPDIVSILDDVRSDILGNSEDLCEDSSRKRMSEIPGEVKCDDLSFDSGCAGFSTTQQSRAM